MGSIFSPRRKLYNYLKEAIIVSYYYSLSNYYQSERSVIIFIFHNDDGSFGLIFATFLKICMEDRIRNVVVLYLMLKDMERSFLVTLTVVLKTVIIEVFLLIILYLLSISYLAIILHIYHWRKYELFLYVFY